MPKPAGGRRAVYLGPWNRPDSKAEYARVIAEVQRHPAVVLTTALPRPDITVSELLLAFWRFAERYYPPQALGNYRDAVRPLRAL